MDERNNVGQDLEEIITNMETVGEVDQPEVPLFSNVGFETPFTSKKNHLPTVKNESNVGEYTIIGKSTIIDSNITCGGNIRINGQIKGNVQATGSVEINGAVDGDIIANDVTLRPTSRVVGNISCKTDLYAEANSSIKGNIVAKNGYVSSTIEGNVETSSELKIASTGSIIGNIVTVNISVQSGAVINGNMTIKR